MSVLLYFKMLESVVFMRIIENYIRNYGREKVINLVNYRRELEMASAVSTGTDGVIEESQRKRYTEKQREVQRYAEAGVRMLCMEPYQGHPQYGRSLPSGNRLGIYSLAKKKSQLYD